MAEVSEMKVYQFFQDLSLPVFIQFDAAEFDDTLPEFLASCGFSEATESPNLGQNGKILELEVAGPLIAKQIDQIQETDRFGFESILPKSGYQVYRYKGEGLLIYSLGSSNWKLGTFEDFGSSEGNRIAYRIIINRFLSWALSSSGIAGLWGLPSKKGIAVMSAIESAGHAVFLDITNKRLLTGPDVITPMRSRFEIARSDTGGNSAKVGKRMTGEELYGFLFTHSTFFTYDSPSVPVRQILRKLATVASGIYQSKDEFPYSNPDLSL